MFTVLYFTTRFFLEYFKEYQFLSPSFPLSCPFAKLVIKCFVFLYFLFVKKYFVLLDEELPLATGPGSIEYENKKEEKRKMQFC